MKMLQKALHGELNVKSVAQGAVRAGFRRAALEVELTRVLSERGKRAGSDSDMLDGCEKRVVA